MKTKIRTKTKNGRKKKNIKSSPISRENLAVLYDRAKEFLDSDTVSAQATKTALALIVAATVMSVIVVAPGLTILARHFRRSRHYSNKEVHNSLESLRRNNFITEYRRANEKPRIILTKKGEAYFKKIIFEDMRLPTQAEWDGKWRFVLFDVPLSHNRARAALRFRLRTLGFYQYQKSVWAYPYPCEKEILYVADYFGVGKYVEIFEAAHLSKEDHLKKHFGL